MPRGKKLDAKEVKLAAEAALEPKSLPQDQKQKMLLHAYIIKKKSGKTKGKVKIQLTPTPPLTYGHIADVQIDLATNVDFYNLLRKAVKAKEMIGIDIRIKK